MIPALSLSTDTPEGYEIIQQGMNHICTARLLSSTLHDLLLYQPFQLEFRQPGLYEFFFLFLLSYHV